MFIQIGSELTSNMCYSKTMCFVKWICFKITVSVRGRLNKKKKLLAHTHKILDQNVL